MSEKLSKAPIFDGIGYEPSLFSLSQFTVSKTDYKFENYKKTNTDKKKKVLVLCAEQKYMTMTNQKKFSTGNHPVETFIPILHLNDAGFDIDIYTLTGKPAILELWAIPKLDIALSNVIAKYSNQLEKPKSLKKFVDNNFTDTDNTEYVALFLPGGHGAMLDLPQSEDLKNLINWIIKKDKFIFSLCHGPAALLAALDKNNPSKFPFNGYKINAFPDEMDKKHAEIGYQPGDMSWFFGEKLQELGVELLNNDISGACHRDRKLITGDSPLASNKFGKMCAEALLNL